MLFIKTLELSPDIYLSLLARQGKIDAFKKGRNWLTSREAVKRYVPGRKRKLQV